MKSIALDVATEARPRVDAAARSTVRAQPYLHPYLAGVGIGLTLLAAFVIIGRGLGASGAFTSVVSVAVAEAAPAHAASNPMYSPYLGDGSRSPLADWLIFEIIGVTIGGLVSARLAGRFRFTLDRGPRAAVRSRMITALFGGALMGFGAKLARGCTSGLALTGGALLTPGAWIFIAAAFGAGFLVAPLVRRQWT